MRHAGLVDFLFTGLALLPAVLLLSGHIGPAMLLFVPLLVAACLSGMYQQQAGHAQSAATESAGQASPDGSADTIGTPGEPRQI